MTEQQHGCVVYIYVKIYSLGGFGLYILVFKSKMHGNVNVGNCRTFRHSISCIGFCKYSAFMFYLTVCWQNISLLFFSYL